MHFQKIFEVLIFNDIFVNLKKTFINYLIVNLLKQHVNSFDLIIDKKKLKLLRNLFFSQHLNN